MAKVSQKIHNYNYAPGIATYGVTGATGETGENGNSIFYTNYNININDESDNEFNEFAALLISGYFPIKGSTTLVNRDYQDGDYFFDNDGIIYQLLNLADLKEQFSTNSTLLDANDYLVIVGKIDIDNTLYVRKLATYNRIEMNSSSFSGFDVNTVTDLTHDNIINDNVVMNIVSETADSNNNINLLLMMAINNYTITSDQFNIYYNIADKAFHIGTNNAPIVIDSDVKVKDTDIQEDLDEYSTVLTSSDPITMFKALASKCTWSIVPTNSSENIVEMIISVDSSNITAYNKFMDLHKNVYVKIYVENGQFLYCLNEEKSNTTITFANNEFIISLHPYFVPSGNTCEPEILGVSLMYNTEFFIKKA